MYYDLYCSIILYTYDFPDALPSLENLDRWKETYGRTSQRSGILTASEEVVRKAPSEASFHDFPTWPSRKYPNQFY